MPRRTQACELVLGPRPHCATLSRWLYDVRGAILDGRLPGGSRLPPTRDLASLYGVSRRTAVTVFEQLASEGYLAGKVGSGTRVNETLPEDLLDVRSPRRRRPTRPAPDAPRERRPSRPFRAIEPALLEFPVELWARVASRRMRRISPSLLAGGEPAGRLPLREAIAGYLGTSRGVRCEAAQIAIVSGVQQAVDLLARLLVRPGDPVWIEDPGYVGTIRAFRAAGAGIVAVPVDGDGLDVAAGRRASPEARLAYVTPAHQFPLGVTMSLARRLLLLKWAHESGARIIEEVEAAGLARAAARLRRVRRRRDQARSAHACGGAGGNSGSRRGAHARGGTSASEISAIEAPRRPRCPPCRPRGHGGGIRVARNTAPPPA